MALFALHINTCKAKMLREDVHCDEQGRCLLQAVYVLFWSLLNKRHWCLATPQE